MKHRHLDIDRLVAFVAVARSGSFTAAAQRLDSAKSALSQAVTRLEKDLGVQLLQRSTRRLAITEAGAEFLSRCESLLSQAEELMESARGVSARLSGTLRITSAPDLTPRVAQWIMRYRTAHPAMRIDYQPTDRRVDIIEGGFDLGLRIGLMRDSRLRAVKLDTLQLHLVAAASYLQRHGEPRRAEDLQAHEWIAYANSPTPWTFTLRSRANRVTNLRMQGAILVSTGEAQRALALAGAGIAALPEWMVRADITAGRLQRLLPAYRAPELSFFAVYPGRLDPPAKTRAFIDLMRDTGSV